MFKWLENLVVSDFEKRGVFYDALLRAHREANVEFYGHDKWKDSLLSIPPVFRAVDFLSKNLASLPLQVYDTANNILPNDPAANVLSKRPAMGRTSYDWRFEMWKKVFTEGRAITYIERSPNGTLRRLHWDILPSEVKVEVNKSGDWEYHYSHRKRGKVIWPANRVIDITWVRDETGLSSISPTNMFWDTMLQAFYYRDFRTKLAKTGGHMPVGIKHRWGSKPAVESKQDDLMSKLRSAFEDGSLAVPLPKETEIVNLGMTPRDTQMMESQQYILREVSRIWGVPPIYLHDIDRMTFANAEHQGISFVNYTLRAWAVQFEEQLTQKMLGGGKTVKHNMDDLLRGDYAARVGGHSTAIFSGQKTPNEVRREEGDPPHEHGDKLFMQSGTMPIDKIEDQINQQNQPQGDNDDGTD